jgi:hypothetical protein
MGISGNLAVIGAVGLLLSACNSVIIDDSPGPRYSYFDGDFEYATHQGAIVTEIAGNPFAGSSQDFGRTVRSYMHNQISGAPAEFVSEHGDKTVRPHKVVVAFNAPPNNDGHDICETGGKTPSSNTGGSLRMAIALCIGDSLKSDAYGSVSGVAGAGDARFKELVQGVTRAMIPAQDGEDAGDGGNVN